ncbi:MAG: glycosyltransferase family 4 protein [Chitinophagaceae bacterium]|nr:MAG: glycosyltransferase family 4 protein [Chitinophagaceae bacterium]
MDKAHILIACSRIDLPGGIERAVVNTANLFYENDHQVTLLILDTTEKSFYPLNAGISVVQAPLHFGIIEKGNVISRKLDFLQHVQLLKKTLRQLKVDILIGTEYSITIPLYLAAGKSKAKIIAWEHHHFYWLKRSFFWQKLFDFAYPKLDRVVCLNPEEKSLFSSAGCKAVEIPNFIQRNTKADTDKKTILTVGWLIRRKGVDLIPAIAEKIFRDHPTWSWKIIGTGEEENKLRQAIAKKNLESQVQVVHPLSFDLSKDYQQTAIYAMTSRFECFPMVLLEAMSHGIPCVSFNCPTGPSFIIDDQENGLLVSPENVDEIADALIRLIENERLRSHFSNLAYEKALTWASQKVYQKWNSFFNELQS